MGIKVDHYVRCTPWHVSLDKLLQHVFLPPLITLGLFFSSEHECMYDCNDVIHFIAIT